MAVSITHHTQPAGTDSGDGKVSKNAWAEDHDVSGLDLVPTAIQEASNAANTASLDVTISAASVDSRLIVIVGSNARDVNTPTCTNVTFTEVLAAAYTTTVYLSIYVGVVSGGSSGTTINITATGSNYIFADVYEVSDALTPTAGSSATLTDTSVGNVLYQNVGPLTPSRGTFVIFGAFEANGTTTMPFALTCPYYARIQRGTLAGAIAYAPGGTLAGYVTNGTGGADFVAGIVAVT